MHATSFRNMRQFVSKYLQNLKSAEISILDVGSMGINGDYKSLFNNPLWNYTGLDTNVGDNVDIVVKNVYYWNELRSSSFDVIITGQAFEHIEFFWLTALEISRVLKPGGYFCLIVPSAGPEHRFPVDCWRIFPDGARAIATYMKLTVLDCYIDTTDTIWKDCVLIAKK